MAEPRQCVCEYKWKPATEWEACPACLLTPKQAEVNALLAGPQRHTLIYGGARSGKTMLIVRALMMRALRAHKTRHAILRLRGNAARASIWLDTLPKVAQLWFPGVTWADHRMDGFVRFDEQFGGSEIWITGTDDQARVEKILGQEFLSLFFNECSQIPYQTVLTILTRLAQVHPEVQQRAYYDLNPVGTQHYTAQLFVQGRDPLTLRPITKADAANRRYAYMNPKDNLANLSQEYLDSLESMPERQRRRFYEGVYQNEIDGALWSFEALEAARIEPAEVPETLRRSVVAIDPSGTTGKDEKLSNDVGIVVAAKDDAGIGYILADRTCQLPPEGWARVAVNAYKEFKCDRIVAESNFGGDMVRANIHAIDRNVSVRLVSASRGKAVRAEPVSALYGRRGEDGSWIAGKVRHVGHFPELEDQMLNFATNGYQGARSPDRADAMVWALTDLVLEEMSSFGLYEIIRRQSDAIDAKRGLHG